MRKERLDRFRQAAFSLHVEEHFSRTKRDRDRIIYSMLRCSKVVPRLEELSLAIREGELILQLQRFVFLKALKVLKVDELDLFLLMLVIQSFQQGWPKPMKGI